MRVRAELQRDQCEQQRDPVREEREQCRVVDEPVSVIVPLPRHPQGQRAQLECDGAECLHGAECLLPCEGEQRVRAVQCAHQEHALQHRGHTVRVGTEERSEQEQREGHHSEMQGPAQCVVEITCSES